MERLRSSLFFVPLIFVISGALLGQGTLWLDQALDAAGSLPLVLQSTVDNARQVLSTVAAATIGFAGIAFSVSLLVIQKASSQYSPRIVTGLFRDPFNKRVMGIVLGTFTYCLVVLRAVRSPLEDGGTAVVPAISVTIAVVLGLIAILAVVAFIDHSAHSMDVSELLDRVTRESLATIDRVWENAEQADPLVGAEINETLPTHSTRFHAHGWVQRIDQDALLRLTPQAGVLRCETTVGRYAITGTPAVIVQPEPTDLDEFDAAVRAAIRLGPSRTSEQDPTYGVRQLADVGLRALSPGVNDPTTAQDAIFHLTQVLHELLSRNRLADVLEGEYSNHLILTQTPTPTEIVNLGFDQLRRAAYSHPTVCIYLLEAMSLLKQSLPNAAEAQRAISQQASMLVAGARAAGLIADDFKPVSHAYAKRFE